MLLEFFLQRARSLNKMEGVITTCWRENNRASALGLRARSVSGVKAGDPLADGIQEVPNTASVLLVCPWSHIRL